MKQLAWTISLVAALCAFTSAQEAAKSNCPTLEITGPAGITAPGDSMILKVTTSAPLPPGIRFDWTISAGIIVFGQGTDAIKVIAPSDGTAVRATVKIIGLQVTYDEIVSQDFGVSTPIACGLAPDQWGNLKPIDEKARLQNAANLFEHNPNTVLVFMISLTADETHSQAQKRASFIRNYLLGNHLIPPDRLQIAFRNDEISETTVFLAPPEKLAEFLKSFDSTSKLEVLRPIGKSSL